MKKYTVVKIEEDIDFGCEERMPGSPVMAVVTLKDIDGKEQLIRYPDKELYVLDINEGSAVVFDGVCLKKADV